MTNTEMWQALEILYNRTDAYTAVGFGYAVPWICYDCRCTHHFIVTVSLN